MMLERKTVLEKFKMLKTWQLCNSIMQRLGILATIALLSSALVGPIGLSFAEMTNSNTTAPTNSTEVPITSMPPIASAPQTSTSEKTLTEQQRIQLKIQEERARLKQLHDEKVTTMKQKSIQQTKTLDDIVALRMKALELKQAKSQHKTDVTQANMTSTIQEKIEQKKTKLQEQLKKRIENLQQRQEDAKKKFDEKTAKNLEKFNKKVQRMTQKTLAPNEQHNSNSTTDSSPMTSGTETNSTENKTKTP